MNPGLDGNNTSSGKTYRISVIPQLQSVFRPVLSSAAEPRDRYPGPSYVHVSAGGMPGSGLPISATGIKNMACPIATVSVMSAFGS